LDDDWWFGNQAQKKGWLDFQGLYSHITPKPQRLVFFSYVCLIIFHVLSTLIQVLVPGSLFIGYLLFPLQGFVWSEPQCELPTSTSTGEFTGLSEASTGNSDAGYLMNFGGEASSFHMFPMGWFNHQPAGCRFFQGFFQSFFFAVH